MGVEGKQDEDYAMTTPDGSAGKDKVSTGRDSSGSIEPLKAMPNGQ
jgi:hypothetical protein